MSKPHYLRCTSLHSLPKFSSKTKDIQIGMNSIFCVLFLIPVTLAIHDIAFELFTLISETHKI